MKKIFIISSVLLVLVLAFLGVYNFAFKNNSTDPVADQAKLEELKKEASGALSHPVSAIELAINDTVLGATTDGDSIFYYSLRENAFRKSGLDGSGITTLFENFPEKPIRLVWSPKHDKVLIFANGTEGAHWLSLDLETKSLVPLKGGMDRLAWTNLGDNILYEYADPASGKKTLNVANPDGSGWRRLTSVGEGSYFISPVPRSSFISFWKKPNGLETNSLSTVALTEETQKNVFSGRFGSDFLWSKDGNRLLIGSVTDKGSSLLALGVANDQGGEYRDLLAPTLVSKVVWSGDNQTIFYALPSPFEKGSILPNDYYGKPIYTKDTFWKMDVTTGKKERLIPLNEIEVGIDATDLFVSTDETRLFFTDRASNKLYRIKL